MLLLYSLCHRLWLSLSRKQHWNPWSGPPPVYHDFSSHHDLPVQNAIIVNLPINPFVVLTFTSVDKILWCDHSNEISLGVLSCGVICFKKFYKMKFGIFVEFAFGHIIYLAVKGLRWNEIWNALPVICWVHRRLRAKNRIHVYQHCFTDLTYWSWG